MGHYLSTLNPRAAAPVALPRLGQTVLYYPRPGEMPGGYSEFAMMVLHIERDGRVGGRVFLEGEVDHDRAVPPVHQRSDQNRVHCWDWMEQQAAGNSVDELRVALAQLQQRVTALEQMEIADYSEAVEDHHERIERLEQRAAVATAPPDAHAERISVIERELGLRNDPPPEGESKPKKRTRR